jgi:hypothetical protein
LSGADSVGLAGLMAARLAGCDPIIAFDIAGGISPVSRLPFDVRHLRPRRQRPEPLCAEAKKKLLSGNAKRLLKL